MLKNVRASKLHTTLTLRLKTPSPHERQYYWFCNIPSCQQTTLPNQQCLANRYSTCVKLYFSCFLFFVGDKTAAIQRASGSHFVPPYWTILAALILSRVERDWR